MSTQESQITAPARPWEIKSKLGMKSGKLTVIAFEGVQEMSRGRTGAMWSCRRDCGNTVSVQTGNLRQETDPRGTKSCGCTRDASWDKFVVRVRASYKRECEDPFKLKRRPYRKDRGFNLTITEVDSLIRGNCFYCGRVPQNKSKLKKAFFMWNGIDRKDNSRGYVVDNVVSCCRQCNIAKGTLSSDAFVSWARLVVAFQSSSS